MLCKRSLLASAAAMLAAAAAAVAAPAPPTPSSSSTSQDTALQLHRLARDAAAGRGYDDHHYMPATPAPPPPEPERGKADAAAISSYYEFLVNEGSFKFWAVFEIVTAALLIYSAFAAIYYAKYTYATTEYDYDYLWKRSGDLAPSVYDDDDAGGGGGGGGSSSFLGMSSSTFQRIMDAISSKKYS